MRCWWPRRAGLPQYQDQIPAAQARLDAAARNNTRARLREGWKGAARLHTKSVAEMEEDRARGYGQRRGPRIRAK